MQLARVVRRRTVQAGEVLWRQGDDAREMVFVVDGAVSASLHVPGDRSVEIGRAGPGDVVGEIGDARRRRAHDERARDGDRDGARARPGGFRSAARRPASVGLRAATPARGAQHRAPSQPAPAPRRSLGGGAAGPPAEDAERALADLEDCGPPDSRYVRRMATFHDFEPLALWGFLTSGRYVRCPPGRTLLAEGCAVDRLLPDDQRRGREGAGPRRLAASASDWRGRGRRSATRASSTVGPPRSPRSRGSERSCSSCRATRSSSSSTGRTPCPAVFST